MKAQEADRSIYDIVVRVEKVIKTMHGEDQIPEQRNKVSIKISEA